MHRTLGQAAFAEGVSQCPAKVAVMDGSVFEPADHGFQPNVDQQFTPPPA
jgi:hypothetical protein